jgi:transcriptional regulator with XRE-family HTH domain
MLCEYVKALKAKKGLTNAQIAAISGVSESTISRMIKGEGKSVDYGSVLNVIKALGGSLDEAAGIACEDRSANNDTHAHNIEADLAAVEARATQTFMRHFEEHTNIIHRERVESLREIIAHKDKTIRMLLIALFVALGILVGQWILDALIGTAGWVRY